jgi:putative endonuclease
MIDGFTRKYRLHRLVYFEFHATFSDAILREKALKRWRREWKIALIESANPSWRDLFGVLTESSRIFAGANSGMTMENNR